MVLFVIDDIETGNDIEIVRPHDHDCPEVSRPVLDIVENRLGIRILLSLTPIIDGKGQRAEVRQEACNPSITHLSLGDMLKNQECSAIIQVVGAGSGAGFDLDQARYGKVIFMADADSDGAHIRCLLATLFFRYMRPMIEAGRVYSAVPPLHRFELTNPRKGMEKYIYTYSDPEYQRKMAELTKKRIRFKEPQRYKGLGEMDADQLADTTMNPRHRMLRRITIDDAETASRTFELLMGNEVAPRKEFIVAGAYQLDEDRIDV